MKQEKQHEFYRTLKHFEQMPEMEFPEALHGRIMRSLYLQQFKLPLVLINAILFVNLSISGFHLWNISSGGFREAYRTLAQAPNEGALSSAGQVFLAMPWESSAIFIANLALMAGGIYLLHRLRALMLMTKATRTSR